MRFAALWLLILGFVTMAAAFGNDCTSCETMPTLTEENAATLVEIALEGVAREYPNQISHYMTSDADLRPPRDLTPAFFGCFDWHSAVHSHWQLARLARTFPTASFVSKVLDQFELSFSAERMAAETEYVSKRTSFERPYGMAWLMQLYTELYEWARDETVDKDLRARAEMWCDNLTPLVLLGKKGVSEWLPKLTHPVRTGEHSNTAFSMGLFLDYARITGDAIFEKLISERILTFHAQDSGWNTAFEPSGHDFLSPSFTVCDIMRRVMNPTEYALWLKAFLPSLPTTSQCESSWMVPVEPADRTDGKLAHFDGLNLSRAWMLHSTAISLPDSDPRKCPLLSMAGEHAKKGISAVLDIDMDYMGSHWLGSFAVYLTTGRGL